MNGLMERPRSFFFLIFHSPCHFSERSGESDTLLYNRTCIIFLFGEEGVGAASHKGHL